MTILLETFTINDLGDSVPTVLASDHIVSIKPTNKTDNRCIISMDDGVRYLVDESYDSVLNAWKGAY